MNKINSLIPFFIKRNKNKFNSFISYNFSTKDSKTLEYIKILRAETSKLIKLFL